MNFVISKVRIWSVIILILFAGKVLPNWQQEVAQRNLSQRYTITGLGNEVVKMVHRRTGQIKYLNVQDQGNLPDISPTDMQFFDLIHADTNLYKNRYVFHSILLVIGGVGRPLLIEDLNRNNKIDIVGEYSIKNWSQPADCAVIEVEDDTSFVVRKIYEDTVVVPLAITDVDKDSLKEINFKIEGGQWFYNYESWSLFSYPQVLNFRYRMWEISGAVGSETFLDMDNDGITDVIYVGADTLPPHGQKVYIAEYDKSVNNFVRKFRYPPPEWRVSGFSVGDFDQDGFKEFVTGSINGDVYVFENTGNDTYDLVFSDTISTPNAYLTYATNDMDGNGKAEFFVGGSSYYEGIAGTRVYWFEADGDNHYRKVRTFFLWGTDVLGTTEMYAYDVNADGIEDLTFAFSKTVVILIWNPAGYFDLYYLDWWENRNQEIESVTVNDFLKNKEPYLFVSVYDYVSTPILKSYCYKNNFVTNIKEPINKLPNKVALFQNYPNPFNSFTNIQFHIDKRESIHLKIFNINGKEVIDLTNGQEYLPGTYSVYWDGKNKHGKEVSSGVYFYQLITSSHILTRKMLLIR